MFKRRFVSVRRLVLDIIAIFLTVSLALELFLGYYLKQEALRNLALDDARRTSELVFENLYTKMQEGWSKADIQKILSRLNTLRDGMLIRVYRSPVVEAKFGVIEADRRAVAEDALIREAMRGNEIIRVMEQNRVRYLYPVKVKKACLQCHDNAKVGDINGVIDIWLPAGQIVVSLDRMVYYFIIALAAFLLLFFLFFYWIFDRRLVRPMVDLTGQIQARSRRLDLREPVAVTTDCRELKTLERVFNEMMRQIRYYYDKLLRNASIDRLTGLLNMYRLKRDLDGKKKVSVMLLNIDNFKEINDYYGFEMGDRILRSAAAVLKDLTDGRDPLYRLGGSEFVLVREGPFDAAEVSELLAQLHERCHKLPGMEDLRIRFTAGLVLQQRERLIEKASIALSAAKRRNRPFEFYRNARQVEAEYQRHIRWMKEVDEALEEGRVLLYYQPIVPAVGAEGTGRYEALVRLVDRDGTVHTPAEFLDVVQRSRLYAKLTRAVMQKAFAAFEDNGCAFSINLSINDIKDPLCRDFVYESLRRFRDPSRVTFEILESEEVSDFDLVNDFIGRIRRLGGKVAIDDFGSGYSNFHYLLKMKVDYFKIDASLIRNVHTDPDTRMLVESIVQFAKKLGVETVAEYVADEAIAKACVALGIDYLQGYYIGPPEPLPEGCA